MKFHRSERVSQLIRDLMSEIILRELEFSLGTLVTVTDVVVPEDIEHAKIKVSVLPAKEEKNVFKVLGKFRGRLQYLLEQKLNMRPMPQIVFEIDHGLENAAMVEKRLLEQ